MSAQSPQGGRCHHLIACSLLLAVALVAPPAVLGGAEVVYENTLGMRFVPVQGSKVLFSIWETRVSDYRAFLDDAARKHPNATFTQGDDHPVVNVSWGDAFAFCDWLGKRESEAGYLPPRTTYRLPSSAEWDRAAGLPARPREEYSGTLLSTLAHERRFAWGTAWPPPAEAGNYHPDLNIDSFPQTSPVGSFPANRNGLHDMGGNVREWSADWFNDSPDYRVLRGSSWRMRNPADLLIGNQVGNLISLRLDAYGFRCVIDAPAGARSKLRAASARIASDRAESRLR